MWIINISGKTFSELWPLDTCRKALGIDRKAFIRNALFYQYLHTTQHVKMSQMKNCRDYLFHKTLPLMADLDRA